MDRSNRTADEPPCGPGADGTFFRSAPDALAAHVCVVDAAGTVLAVNRAWRTFAAANGGDPAALSEGADYLAACDAAGDDGPAFAAGVRSVLRGDRPEFARDYPCHPPGGRRWFLGRATRFPGPGPARAVVAHEDVTARVLAEEAARAERRRRDEFLVTLAHELRNPPGPGPQRAPAPPAGRDEVGGRGVLRTRQGGLRARRVRGAVVGRVAPARDPEPARPGGGGRHPVAGAGPPGAETGGPGLVRVSAPGVRTVLLESVWAVVPPAERTLSWPAWRRAHQDRARKAHHEKRRAKPPDRPTPAVGLGRQA